LLEHIPNQFLYKNYIITYIEYKNRVVGVRVKRQNLRRNYYYIIIWLFWYNYKITPPPHQNFYGLVLWS
jgi:hypothetical protein